MLNSDILGYYPTFLAMCVQSLINMQIWKKKKSGGYVIAGMFKLYADRISSWQRNMQKRARAD